MAGYCPRPYFCVFIVGPRLRLGPQTHKKEFGKYPAVLTSPLVNNQYISSLYKWHFTHELVRTRNGPKPNGVVVEIIFPLH